MQDTVEVPQVGGDVQIRPIPPKLQRAIHAKATKGGRIDLNELGVQKFRFGLKDPSFTEAQARAVWQRWTLRILQPIVDRIDELSGTDEHLRGDSQPYAVRKFTEPVMIATAWLGRFAPPHARARESHRSKPVHRRGSRRFSPPTRGDPDDPDPPKPCACGCGLPRRPELKYYATDDCRKRHARERKQQQRARDRDEPNRVVERRLPGLTLADLPTKCRPGCCGEAVYEDPEGAIVCVACGRLKTRGRLRVNGYDAHLAEVRGWMRNDRAAVQHSPAPREWRTRPSRKMGAKLRKTRGRWDVAREEGAA
jgi:hypothetical protein